MLIEMGKNGCYGKAQQLAYIFPTNDIQGLQDVLLFMTPAVLHKRRTRCARIRRSGLRACAKHGRAGQIQGQQEAKRSTVSAIFGVMSSKETQRQVVGASREAKSGMQAEAGMAKQTKVSWASTSGRIHLPYKRHSRIDSSSAAQKAHPLYPEPEEWPLYPEPEEWPPCLRRARKSGTDSGTTGRKEEHCQCNLWYIFKQRHTKVSCGASRETESGMQAEAGMAKQTKETWTSTSGRMHLPYKHSRMIPAVLHKRLTRCPPNPKSGRCTPNQKSGLRACAEHG